MTQKDPEYIAELGARLVEALRDFVVAVATQEQAPAPSSACESRPDPDPFKRTQAPQIPAPNSLPRGPYLRKEKP